MEAKQKGNRVKTNLGNYSTKCIPIDKKYKL